MKTYRQSRQINMNVNRLPILCVELYETRNNFNLNFIKGFFALNETVTYKRTIKNKVKDT